MLPDSLVIVLVSVVGPPQHQTQKNRKRLNFLDSLDLGDRFGRSSYCHQIFDVVAGIAGDEVRIKLEGSLEFSASAGPIPLQHMRKSERGVGFTERVI